MTHSLITSWNVSTGLGANPVHVCSVLYFSVCSNTLSEQHHCFRPLPCSILYFSVCSNTLGLMMTCQILMRTVSCHYRSWGTWYLVDSQLKYSPVTMETHVHVCSAPLRFLTRLVALFHFKCKPYFVRPQYWDILSFVFSQWLESKCHFFVRFIIYLVVLMNYAKVLELFRSQI